ncbi:MAG: hypothetical protein JSW58_06285 [Candidatus Latescibacterota bacterium]|nr:MAG: hypothetical protein JSW58_06285 [Candidatus Latescibacterota bacterium]
MGLINKLAGIIGDVFSLGKDGIHGIKIVAGRTGYFDPIDGERKFSEMTAESDQDRMIITTDGGLVYRDNGEIVLKKVEA